VYLLGGGTHAKGPHGGCGRGVPHPPGVDGPGTGVDHRPVPRSRARRHEACNDRGVSEQASGTEFVRPRAAHNAPVELAEPDPAWRDQYAGLARAIHDALGPNAVVVAHVGSTSVPGLPAKPIIDVLLVVDDPADEESYVPALEAAGFELHLREPGWQEHRLLRHAAPTANLHVFAADSAEAERMLLFRDRLRADVIRSESPTVRPREPQ